MKILINNNSENKNKKIDRGSESPSFTCSKKVIKENAYPSNSFVVKNNVVRTIEYLKPTKLFNRKKTTTGKKYAINK